MRAECFYCGNPTFIAKHGLIYLHKECFEEITDTQGQIEFCVKYVKGELPKFMANGDRIGYESFEKFLISMQDFQKRWKHTTKIIKMLCKQSEELKQK